jgi:hypothetical protein
VREREAKTETALVKGRQKGFFTQIGKSCYFSQIKIKLPISTSRREAPATLFFTNCFFTQYCEQVVVEFEFDVLRLRLRLRLYFLPQSPHWQTRSGSN